MKKSREHFKRFLSTLRPASEQDEHLIRLFLSKRKIKTPPLATNSDIESLDEISYVQFESWANTNMPAFGELVKSSKNNWIGLVAKERWDSFVLGIVLNSNSELSFDELTISDLDWTIPSSEERRAFQKALAQKGYDWDYVSAELKTREIPTSPQFVRLMELGKEIGIGVFKEILPDNTLTMFCVKIQDEKIRFQGVVNLGDSDFYSFSKTYEEHRALIQSELAEEGYIWNSKCFRIEKNKARAKLGKPYFSISNILKIKSHTEKNTSYDRERFNKGNYFLSRAVAERVRNKIQLIFREEMLADDNR